MDLRAYSRTNVKYPKQLRDLRAIHQVAAASELMRNKAMGDESTNTEAVAIIFVTSPITNW